MSVTLSHYTTKITIRICSYTADNTTFLTEASRIGWAAGTVGREVELVSHKTGKTMHFVFVCETYDPLGEDVIQWEYEAYGFRLIVING